MPLPLNTQTFINSSGKVQVVSNPQPCATGFSPANGSRTANGYTVFRNNGGAGSAMDSSGNIRTGRFDIQPSTGRTVFVADRYVR
jgi:hypothetical protein